VINKFTKEESSAENAAERAEKDGGSISKRWLAFNRHRKPTKKKKRIETVKTTPLQFIYLKRVFKIDFQYFF